MQYQNCRWYDVYPRLAFVLKLISLMPHERQSQLGVRLNQYLTHRAVTAEIQVQGNLARNRWYDEVPPLVESLERLKYAPNPVKQQTTEFLYRLLSETESKQWCA